MRKIILFGAGHYGRDALSYFGVENVFCFCDNRVKGDDEKEISGKKIISFERLLEIWQEYIVVVCIKLEFCLEVCNQLEGAGVNSYVVFEALRNDKRPANEWLEQLQDREERTRLQKQSYLFMLNKLMAQFKYLQRHVDITTLKPATGELRKRQLKALDYAKEFFEFIKELDIKPFLTFGNLLGAVRHQGFVPWDDDLDFGLIRNEYEKLLEFAREKCVVLTFEPKKDAWADLDGNVIENSMLYKKYPDKYVLNLYPDLIQVIKLTGESWYWVMDLWAYDFYKKEYDIEEHKRWVDQINEKVQTMESCREQMIFVRSARESNPMISEEMTDLFFPGIDNYRGYPGEKEITDWIPTRDIFPLQKVKYENTEFWAPRNMEALLKYEYVDFMKFPDNVGYMTHAGAEVE
ncbi:MAG: LicD family protein [Lachnospiraceae bacterium]|nr:LicD family protein [Lachnospiraceae bacterium]